MVKKIRPAIAMIELIFAITIMGIVLMSAPRLMQVAVNSGYVATQQESIAEAATKVNMLLGYSWDERIADDSNMSTILTVTAGDTSLNNTPNMRRMGTPPISYRAFVDTNGTTLPASAIALDAGELVENDFDDIDDFNGTVTNLTDLTAGGADVDYIDKNITLTTAISYSDDNVSGTGYQQNSITYTPFSAAAAGTTTNIKSISVTLTSTSGASELSKNITLQAFSSNIGSYQLEERNF